MPVWTHRDQLIDTATIPLLLLTCLVLLRTSSAGEVALDGPTRERLLLRCSGVMGCLGTFRAFFFNAHSCCVVSKLIPAFWGLYYGLSNAGSCFILYRIFIFPLVSWDWRHCSGLYLCLFKHVICSCGDMHPRDFSPISPPQMLPSAVAYTLSTSGHPVRVLDFFVFVLDTLNVKAKALFIVGKHSATELDHQPTSG